MHPANFRDVGEALGLWLTPSPIPAGRLFRGGSFDALAHPEELGDPKTILNLRRGPDSSHLPASLIHLPAPDDLENYDTGNRRVSGWVRRALAVLAGPETPWPVYIHCTSGRDRTGVVVAAALAVVGIPHDVIAEEYLLSTGGTAALIQGALSGLRSFTLDAAAQQNLRRNLLAEAG